MRFAMFYHSLVSDWNHGNAHFLRGIVSELIARGHHVTVYEPRDGWSYSNLVHDHGRSSLRGFYESYPTLESVFYELDTLILDDVLHGADAVLVHEWNPPELISRIGAHRRRGGRYKLLFHDTHHRSVSESHSFGGETLRFYDGALVFGESLRNVYLANNWTRRVWVWHEAADTHVFTPVPSAEKSGDIVWIGNWGDGERSQELHRFLLAPVRAGRFRSTVHGVRYPNEALQELIGAGIEYGGWLPNYRVPQVLGRFLMTVHIPRNPYFQALPGIPTIRVFEALACGIPLICAPWDDSECLFTAGKDYLTAYSTDEMTDTMRELATNDQLRKQLSAHGLRTIAHRHTCAHRVDELLEVIQQ